MSSTILLIVLLFAHITGLISEQLLKATVGGSILIPCSLPGYPPMFFWQEGKKHFFHWENGIRKEAPNEKYENRSEIFPSEFSSGNISFRLDNISLEDDQKTFFAIVKLDKQKPSEQHCRSRLQVSGLISEQLLNAAVGGSVLIPCSLPGYPLTFYWQEDQSPNLLCHWDGGKTLAGCEKYEGRFQVFNSEFSSGNISIRLHNISFEDDQKTFFAYVKFDKQMHSGRWCESRLQVSAPYQDLVLMVKVTTNIATCSARGGYPAAQVSWTGLTRSNDKELDLQDAETFLQQDPTEKTFSFTSSVHVTGLKSVTCLVYNPQSNKTITVTEKIPGENWRHHFVLIAAFAPFIPVILILAGVIAGLYWSYKRQPPAPDQEPDPPNEPPVDPNAQDGAQDEALDLAQDPDPPNELPVEPKPQDGAQAEDADAAEPAQDPVQEEADEPEAAVLPSQNQAVFRRRTRSKGTADSDTDEDAAVSPEKAKLLEKEKGNEVSASD